MFCNFWKILFVWLPRSVHLARRVLQLERQNTSLRRELDRCKLQSGQVSEEVNTHTQSAHVRACLRTAINGISLKFMPLKRNSKLCMLVPATCISHHHSSPTAARLWSDWILVSPQLSVAARSSSHHLPSPDLLSGHMQTFCWVVRSSAAF